MTQARKSNQNTAHHWLIAAWPGMAGVAQTSAVHLIRTLGLQPAGELAPHDHFDIQAVQVKDGMIGKPSLPKNSFFTGTLPGSSDKITVFFGEAQPAAHAYGFAHELLTRAKDMGVDRLATFASFASQLHPSEDPTVFAAGTRRELVEKATSQGAKLLGEAQIGGLNGVLLGAAMHRGIPGLCLLGEIPFFGAQIQNPKAAKHVLDIFGRLSGVTLDTSELDAPAAKVDRILLQLLEQMQAQKGEEPGVPEAMEFDLGEASDEEIALSAEDEPPAEPAAKGLDLAARTRIEALFEAARKDRSRSVALKKALDTHGVFKAYEDRFLDLFKQTD
ncbi:MAG TPA: PAC2 family protein [Phycisphaerales bacterium]|nr:PAC2 family protein [Phycisphaerales bacterium]